MRSFSTLAATLVLLASSSDGLVTLLLDSVAYPDIADHHCLAALCSGLGFTSRNGGFHYATSTNYMSERRKALGCQSSVSCGANKACDSLPYPDTFDGGLSCFAQEWTSSGRPMDYLYTKGTHKCVSSTQQAAATKARSTFYSLMGLSNFQIYSVDVALVGNTGLPDPAAKYCTRFAKANALNQSFAPICKDAANDGSSYGAVTSSLEPGYSNKCPSRSYRRNVDLTDRHVNLAARHENYYDDLRRRQATAGGGVLNYTKFDNGGFGLSLFGNSSVGDSVYYTDGSVTTVSEVHNQPWTKWYKFGLSFACFWWPYTPGC